MSVLLVLLGKRMTFIAQTSMTIILRVPTLNDSQTDCTRLFSLWRQLQNLESQEVIVDFSDCRFLRQNAVAFLGGLARLIQSRNGKVNFAWNTLQDDIRANLTQNGFIDIFDGTQREWLGNSVPYREYRYEDMDAIASYLENCWLGRGWVQVDSASSDEIVQNALEVYSNAFEHSASQIGIFTCGQRYPNLGKLHLTVIDFGVGIPPNVRQFLNQPQKLAADALEWAFKLGNTTRANKISGGTGLNTLKQFVKQKSGKIEVYSHDGYALITSDQEIYQRSPTFFQGTLINITVKCDSPAYNSSESTLFC